MSAPLGFNIELLNPLSSSLPVHILRVNWWFIYMRALCFLSSISFNILWTSSPLLGPPTFGCAMDMSSCFARCASLSKTLRCLMRFFFDCIWCTSIVLMYFYACTIAFSVGAPTTTLSNVLVTNMSNSHNSVVGPARVQRCHQTPLKKTYAQKKS